MKKSSKDQALFSDPVNKAQMFYMDNLLLAVSSNRLFMFNINQIRHTSEAFAFL